MENIFETPSAVQSLRKIPDGENFKRKDEYLGDGKVRVTYAVRAEAQSPRYERQTVFDFSGVDEEQLCLLCCTNGVVVWVQRMLREGNKVTDPSAYTEVNVLQDIIEGDRAVIDPETRARRALGRLTPAQREALLAELSQVA